jgi:hypothetical protein
MVFDDTFSGYNHNNIPIAASEKCCNGDISMSVAPPSYGDSSILIVTTIL